MNESLKIFLHDVSSDSSWNPGLSKVVEENCLGSRAGDIYLYQYEDTALGAGLGPYAIMAQGPMSPGLGALWAQVPFHPRWQRRLHRAQMRLQHRLRSRHYMVIW